MVAAKLRNFGLILFFLVPLSLAQAKPDCAALFKKGDGYTDVAFRDTALGQDVYNKIEQVLSATNSDFSTLVDKAIAENWTEKKLLSQLFEDRQRIVMALEKIRQELPEGDLHRIPLTNVIDKIDVKKNDKETTKLQESIESYGQYTVKSVVQNNGDLGQGLEDLKLFSIGYHAKSHSYLDELITAYEVRGLYATGVHLRDILDLENETLIEKRLEELGAAEVLGYELDVLAYDSALNRFLWIEVKHVANELNDKHNSKVSKWKQIIKKYTRATDLFNNDPILKKLFGKSFELHFVIRGAGMSKDVETYLDTEKVQVHNGNVNDVNTRFITYKKAN